MCYIIIFIFILVKFLAFFSYGNARANSLIVCIRALSINIAKTLEKRVSDLDRVKYYQAIKNKLTFNHFSF